MRYAVLLAILMLPALPSVAQEWSVRAGASTVAENDQQPLTGYDVAVQVGWPASVPLFAEAGLSYFPATPWSPYQLHATTGIDASIGSRLAARTGLGVVRDWRDPAVSETYALAEVSGALKLARSWSVEIGARTPFVRRPFTTLFLRLSRRFK